MRKITLNFTVSYVLISCITFFTILYASRLENLGLLFWPVVLSVYIVGVLIFAFLVDEHSKLIVRLNEMVNNFSQGKLVPTPFVTNDDELGNLNDSLHIMAENLDDYIQKTIHEKDQMETILASMVEGVLAFDSAGRLMLMNRTAEEMIDVSWEEVHQRYFLEILRNHQLGDLLKEGLTDTKRHVIEIKLSPHDSEYYRVYITPIIGKEGSAQGVVMVLRNVTKLRQLEQMRTEFVANVSHELRTPLTSIKGYVETLLDGAIDNSDVAANFLSIINSEADRLHNLINDLLYLSQLETGRMEVAKKLISSQELLDKLIKVLNPVAEAKNITIKTIIHPQAEKIYGNDIMLEQVMINLLDNAIKYSYDNGTVTVEIDCKDDKILINVIDLGIGIPSESLHRLFERFYRVDKARSRQVGGTGLGLSIVKHIIERHRGQILVESEVDKGSTFTVILPRENA